MAKNKQGVKIMGLEKAKTQSIRGITKKDRTKLNKSVNKLFYPSKEEVLKLAVQVFGKKLVYNNVKLYKGMNIKELIRNKENRRMFKDVLLRIKFGIYG